MVITDIVLPELNGLDMLLELTREFLDAKVIAISGAGEEKNVLDVAKLLGHGRPSRSPLACRICWALCDTNWNINRMLADFFSILLIPLDQALHGV